MDLFICSTPLQVLLAILIRGQFERTKDSDLIILNHFSAASSVAPRIRDIDLFESVSVADTLDFNRLFHSRRTIVRRFRTIRHQIAFSQALDRHMPLPKHTYTDLYFSHEDMIIQLAMKELHRRNTSLRVHMFEDGTGSYGPAMLIKGPLRRRFNSVTGHAFMNEPYSEFLVLEPRLVVGSRPAAVRPIPKAGRISIRLRATIDHVFGVDRESSRINENVVFFQQPYGQFPGLDGAIQDVATTVLPEDSVVKLHPREQATQYGDLPLLKHNDAPWEVVAMHNDLGAKTLVSFFSTALTTGKTLMGKEPRVVFLFDIPELRQYFDLPDSLRDFVERFRTTHSDPQRVAIPKSVAEARDILAGSVPA